MKTFYLMTVTFGLCLLVANVAYGESCPVIYHTDFSTEPGWVTDQPANYYWDSTNGWYHVIAKNDAPAYQPNRIFGHILPESPPSCGSFELRWDIQMESCDWSAGIDFGIYDSHLVGAAGAGGQSIQVDMGRGDQGNCLNFQVRASGGNNIADVCDVWDEGQWYTFDVTYNSLTNKVNLDFMPLGGNSIWNSTLDVPGSFTRELIFLGGSRYGMCEGGICPGANPDAIAEGNIDNVNLIPEPATLLLLGLGGLGLLRRRTK